VPAVKKHRIVDSITKESIITNLSNSTRTDNRGLLDYRNLEIEINILKDKTNGSAKVILGNTEVWAGVKVETAQPFPDTPAEGVMTCNAEMLPISSQYVEPGPPNEDTIELSRVSDRGIRESGMIDVAELCIKEGELVYSVYIDVAVINEDGNLFDAVSYAGTAALLMADMSKFTIEDDEVKMLDERQPLPIKSLPVSTTFAKIGDKIILDPNADEQEIADARITLVTDENGKYVSAQKGKPGGFTFDELKEISIISKDKGEEIRKKIKEAVNNGA
tara:strand:- start:193 stop:1020 length:828 start_codon:yes stop_codon:yes gene_type:complete